MPIKKKANNPNETKLWQHESNLAIRVSHTMQAHLQLIQTGWAII